MNAGRKPTTTESSNGLKNILGTRFTRVKLPSRRGDEPAQLHDMTARRSMRWKRTLALVLILVSLFFVVVAEHSDLALSEVIKRKVIAALKDPLTLFDERSPGPRGSGVLISIKGPHERVLSTVRERGSPLGILPVVDNPVSGLVPEAFASIPGAFAASEALPQDQVIGSPFAPFFPAPFDNPGITPAGVPTPNSPTPPPISSTPEPLPNPGIIAIPEPATWTMMILGFLAFGVATRWRVCKRQTSPTRIR